MQVCFQLGFQAPKEGGEDKEENVADPQIRFPLECHCWRFLGLGDRFAAYFPPENTGNLMNEAVWPRLEYEVGEGSRAPRESKAMLIPPRPRHGILL